MAPPCCRILMWGRAPVNTKSGRVLNRPPATYIDHVTLGFVLVGVAVAVGALDWVAVARRNRPAEYVFKPLTMVVLIAAAVALQKGNPTYVCGVTLAALVLSLAGDVFLMLPQDLFVAGLGSFLLAHAAYVAAFNPTAPPLGATLVGGAIVLAVGVPMFLRMARGMLATGHAALVVPVA